MQVLFGHNPSCCEDYGAHGLFRPRINRSQQSNPTSRHASSATIVHVLLVYLDRQMSAEQRLCQTPLNGRLSARHRNVHQGDELIGLWSAKIVKGSEKEEEELRSLVMLISPASTPAGSSSPHFVSTQSGRQGDIPASTPFLPRSIAYSPPLGRRSGIVKVPDHYSRHEKTCRPGVGLIKFCR